MKEIIIRDTTKVIELKKFQLPADRDIMELKSWEDFEYMASDYNSIHQLGNTYYLISSDKIYIFQNGKDKNKARKNKT